MELTQILDAMNTFEARQMVLVSGEALRMLASGGWEQAKSTPSDAVVDALLRQANPGGRLDAGHCEVRHAATTFWITTETAQGVRAVVITRCNIAGLPLASVPEAQRTFLPGSAANAPDSGRSPAAAATAAASVGSGTKAASSPLQPSASSGGPVLQGEIVSPPIASPVPREGGRPSNEGRELGRENDSGSGPLAVLPRELAGFNWGALINPYLWALGNGTWGWGAAIFATQFIPVVGWLISLVLTFVLGFKGNELAWQNHHWQDAKHFKRTQRLWGWLSLVMWIVIIAIIILELQWVISLIHGMVAQVQSTVDGAQ